MSRPHIDVVIPLGMFCWGASAAARLGWRQFALPFDWAVCTVRGVKLAMQDGCSALLRPQAMHYLPGSKRVCVPAYDSMLLVHQDPLEAPDLFQSRIQRWQKLTEMRELRALILVCMRSTDAAAMQELEEHVLATWPHAQLCFVCFSEKAPMAMNARRVNSAAVHIHVSVEAYIGSEVEGDAVMQQTCQQLLKTFYDFNAGGSDAVLETLSAVTSSSTEDKLVNN